MSTGLWVNFTEKAKAHLLHLSLAPVGGSAVQEITFLMSEILPTLVMIFSARCLFLLTETFFHLLTCGKFHASES